MDKSFKNGEKINEKYSSNSSSGPLGFFEFAQSQLRSAGFRITQQRVTLLEFLARREKPLTTLEIAKEINKNPNYESMDQVSVYRILETLKELKLVHQVFPEGGYLACHHASCSTPTHLLMTCNECHSVKEVGIPSEYTLDLQNYLNKNFRFVAQTHPLQIMGKCASCSMVSKQLN